VAFGRQIDGAEGVPYKPRHTRACAPEGRKCSAAEHRDKPAQAVKTGPTGPTSSALAERLRETDLSAQQVGTQAPPRLPCPYGDQGRPQGTGGTASAWAQAAQCVTGARPPFKHCYAMERLKRRSDFRAAASGMRAPGCAFVLRAHKRSDAHGVRVGFTVSRQVGNAVERNRVRRRLREVVRLTAAESAENLRAGHDYVLIGRRAALNLPFGEIKRELDAALRRVHVETPAATGSPAKRPLHEAGSPAPRRRVAARRKPPIRER
jgi:ribonuclease P protein component